RYVLHVVRFPHIFIWNIELGNSLASTLLHKARVSNDEVWFDGFVLVFPAGYREFTTYRRLRRRELIIWIH
uniref:Uncharacterized protein n=1 Tax=Caenorhabditis japonica TaxID=281687 RepID=A0A8R1IEU4_CAEJA